MILLSMMEYSSKAGKVTVCKTRDIHVKETLISESMKLWSKHSPDSYIVNIQLQKPAYMINKNNNVLTENKNATFYDIEADNDIEALRNVHRSIKLCAGIVYHPVFLNIVNEALEKSR